ncbi:MAG TPA: hypothetical protein VHB01_03265 [Nitrosospira sp.]|nr:hypothetical protein [Nitrosospira sp.]
MPTNAISYTRFIFFVFAALFAALPASAHYIWIEQDGAHQSRLFFGEYQEGEREKSPGRLDEIKNPQAWTIEASGKREPLEATRRANHFDLGVTRRTASTVIAEEHGYEVKDWSKNGHGIVKPMFYARYSSFETKGASKPELALDILPEAANGSASRTFTVYFHNSPLVKAKIKIHGPNLSTQEHSTDENGEVTISTGLTGQYVLEVIHREGQPGEFEGKKYEALRHRATLTFIRPASGK